MAAEGQWMDTRHHLALGAMPENSEAIARLNYAKHGACGAYNTGAADYAPTSPYAVCMRGQGFTYVYDSPAQVAARNKAVNDANMRASGYALGQALISAGQAMQPHGCNGQVQPNGYFSTQCY
jgi:hypothetical protein